MKYIDIFVYIYIIHIVLIYKKAKDVWGGSKMYGGGSKPV